MAPEKCLSLGSQNVYIPIVVILQIFCDVAPEHTDLFRAKKNVLVLKGEFDIWNTKNVINM